MHAHGHEGSHGDGHAVAKPRHDPFRLDGGEVKLSGCHENGKRISDVHQHGLEDLAVKGQDAEGVDAARDAGEDERGERGLKAEPCADAGHELDVARSHHAHEIWNDHDDETEAEAARGELHAFHAAEHGMRGKARYDEREGEPIVYALILEVGDRGGHECHCERDGDENIHGSPEMPLSRFRCLRFPPETKPGLAGPSREPRFGCSGCFR